MRSWSQSCWPQLQPDTKEHHLVLCAAPVPRDLLQKFCYGHSASLETASPAQLAYPIWSTDHNSLWEAEMHRMAWDEALADPEDCTGKAPLKAEPRRHLHGRSRSLQAQKQPPAILALASPVPGITPANKPTPSTDPLQGQEFPAQAGHRVGFVQQGGRWRAVVLERLGSFSRQSVLPVCCQGNGDVTAALQALQGKPDKYIQQRIHVLTRKFPQLVYLGEQGLKGGMQSDAGASGSRPPSSVAFQGGSASKTLSNRMDKENINSTEALVEALNAAQSPKNQAALQEWVRAYIEWFNREPVENLTQGQGIALKEYSLLASIRPDSAGQKEILRDYFDSLHRKVQKDKLGKACLIEALEYTLQAMDPDVFEGDPTSTLQLLQLGDEFFSKLDPTRIVFTKATFPTLRSTLSVLHQTLMLIQQIAPSQLNPMQENGLYSRFRARVEAIAENAQYYPVCYHARLLEQSLMRLAFPGNQARFQDRLRRARKGLKGAIFFYKGIKALALLDFDIGSFEAGYESWKAAFSSQHIESKPWYDWHQAMQHACLLNLEDTDQYAVFSECLQGVQKKEASIRKPADPKALRFGLVQQLCLLALEGATAEVRNNSIEKLTSLAHSCNIPDRECWLKDLDILEELLEGLAAIAVQGQAASEKEDAEVALEILTSSTLGGNTHLEAAVRKAVMAWLGEQTLEEKLSILAGTAAEPVSGGLFRKINGGLRLGFGEESQAPCSWYSDLGLAFGTKEHPISGRVEEACRALRAHYLDDNFAQVRSLFDGQLPKHVDTLECQLMLIELVEDIDPQDSACQDDLSTHYERLRYVKTPISMGELFHDRSTHPGKPVREIRKVMLVGNPGTGKTTLSRKLAYRWAKGMWGAGFEAVYVLPVRALQQSAYDNVSFRRHETLANAIVRNCFGPREDEDYKRLRHQISQMLNKTTTLVVLDGLDERYGASELLINQAKSGSHKLLILSRPYGIEAERSLADIEIEHVGFNDAQLEAFVNHELSPEQGSELLAFIQEQPAIGSIAHVPVNLQILCALWQWQDMGGGSGVNAVPWNSSLPGLYHRLTGYVWHRYKEKHRERHFQDQDRDALFAALGQIAVRGMECGELLLSQGLVEGVLAEGEERVREMLKDAGFLLLQDLGKQYQFPHLTFQEYFAGRWLAKQLISKEPRERGKAEKFFLKHRYEHQFRETFSFMAGEVSKRQEVEEMKQLLKLAEAQPQEIIGVQHVLLQVRLVHEWLCVSGEDLEIESANLEGEFQIFESLKGWFQEGIEWVRREEEWYEGDDIELLGVLTAGLRSLRAVSISCTSLLEPLLNACKDSDRWVRHAAHVALNKLVGVFPGQAPALLQPLLNASKDPDVWVRRAIVKSLGKVAEAVPKQAPALLKTLLNACKDSDWEVHRAAFQALWKLIEDAPQQASGLLDPLLDTCKDSDVWFRRIAVKALGKVVEGAPRQASILLQPLLNMYKDSDWGVRDAAIKALGKVVEAAPDQIPALMDCLLVACNDSDIWVRSAALNALGRVIDVVPGQIPAVLEPLLDACKDPEWEVCRAAVKALQKLGGGINACQTANHDARCASDEAQLSVAEAAPGHTSKLLESMLNACSDSDVGVRYGVVQSLRNVVKDMTGKSPAQLGPLLNACKDVDVRVRCVAIEVLGKVVEAASGQMPILDPLICACKDSNRDVRCAAVKTIGKVLEGVPDQTPALLKLILNACRDTEWEVRQASLEALGKVVEATPIHAPSVLETLLKACNDSVMWVRRAALVVIGKVVEVAPEQASILLEPMLSACKDYESLVRRAASRILRQFSLQQLMDGYWGTHNQACIPTIAARLYYTPLIIRSSPKPHHQRLFLYPRAGQVVKWDIPQKEVELFLQKIQMAAKQGVPRNGATENLRFRRKETNDIRVIPCFGGGCQAVKSLFRRAMNR